MPLPRFRELGRILLVDRYACCRPWVASTCRHRESASDMLRRLNVNTDFRPRISELRLSDAVDLRVDDF